MAKANSESAPNRWKSAYVAFGSNLVTEAFPDRAETLTHAIQSLADKAGISLIKKASLYETEPIPRSDQPWYVNTVVLYETRLEKSHFMQVCHDIEDQMGRQRSVPNAARVIDIDLIDFSGVVCGDAENKTAGLVLPHPSAHLRGFVLRPVAELDPNWQHPILRQGVETLIANLPSDQDLGVGMRRYSEE